MPQCCWVLNLYLGGVYFVYFMPCAQVTLNAKSLSACDDNKVLPGKKRVAHISSVGLVKTHGFIVFISARML